jgi:pilus assembly protein FimV
MIPPEFGALSTSSIDPEPEPETEAENTAIAESDPIVERFHALKRKYTKRQERTGAGPGGAAVSSRKTKRNDLQAEIVQAMKTIERQELRQRNKKRAPLPDSDPSVIAQQVSPAGVQQGSGKVASSIRRGGGENRPKRPNSEEEEEEQLESAAEEEEVAEEEEQEQGQSASDDKGGEEQSTEQDEGSEGSEESQEEGDEEDLDAEDDPKAEYQPEGEEQPEDGLAKKLDIDDPGFRYQWHLVS